MGPNGLDNLWLKITAAGFKEFLRARISPDEGSALLEVGPLYTPSIRLQEFPKARIVYWELDLKAIAYLEASKIQGASRQKGSEDSIHVDLNHLADGARDDFVLQNETLLSEYGHREFSAAVVSRVMNYVNGHELFSLLSKVLKRGGRIFVFNHFELGDDLSFHPQRARSIEELEAVARQAGFEVLERVDSRSLRSASQAMWTFVKRF